MIRRSAELSPTDAQFETIRDLALARSVTPEEPACWLAFAVTNTCLSRTERLDALACVMDYVHPEVD